MYMRKYLLPRFRKEDLQDISESVSASSNPNGITRPVIKLWPMLNAHQKKDVMLAQAPVRRAEVGQRFDDERSLLLFSSIM